MNTIAFLDNEKVSAELKNAKIIYFEKKKQTNTCIHDYAKDFLHNKEFYKPEWLQQWAHSTTVKNKTIKEHLIHNNRTLWYLFEYPLYVGASSFAQPGTSAILYWVDCIFEILNKEKPSEIIIQNEMQPFYQLVKKICAQQKIPCKSLHKNTKTKSQLASNTLLTKAYVKTRLHMREMSRNFVKKPKPADIIFLSNHRFIGATNLKNSFWGEVICEIEKQQLSYSVLEYDDIWDAASFRKMISRHRGKGTENAQYIGAFYNKNTRLQTKEILKFCEHAWKELTEGDELEKSLNYRGINISKEVMPRFNFVFSVISYIVADVIALSESVSKTTKPKIVAMDHEMNYYGLGFMLNQSKHKYKTIALQFENVNTRTCVHRYISLPHILDTKSPLWRPIPDKKCVSGVYAAKILLKYCNMPNTNIIVTGQPRYDSFSMKKAKSRQEVCKDLGLDPEKKIIVYGTKFRFDEEEIWEKMHQLVNEKKDWQVIFSLPPVVDAKKYEKYLHPKSRIVVSQHYNILDILSAADLLITIHANVAMEMMAIKKPVLLVDFYKISPFPYPEMGAAFAVGSLESLDKGIEQCLTNKELKSKLTKGAEHFIEEYLYKQDGKAAVRVAKVIEQQLKQEKS